MNTQITVAEAIEKAIGIVGLAPLADACGLKSYQAIRKWQKQDRMPRTEWTGETNYSEIIFRVTDGQVSISDLKPESIKKSA